MTTSSARISDREDPRLEAAQRRLRESANRADALEAIREIVTNLLGCEEIGLFTIERSDSEVEQGSSGVEQATSGLLWSFGIDPQRHKTLDTFQESALPRVLQGELHVARVAHDGRANHKNPPLRVFVPILLHGRTVAVLVMVKLLPQKVGFDEADINLVKLLSDETGGVLFSRSANASA